MKERVAFGLDAHGVLLANPTGVFPVHDAKDAIDYLCQHPNVKMLGVYTKWPARFFSRWTDNQIWKNGFNLPIMHTSLSSTHKIESLLKEAVGIPNTQAPLTADQTEEKMEMADINQIVLIDNSSRGITKGVRQLYTSRPELTPLFRRFTVVGFGRRGTRGTIYPTSVRFTQMRDWGDIDTVLEEVQNN